MKSKCLLTSRRVRGVIFILYNTNPRFDFLFPLKKNILGKQFDEPKPLNEKAIIRKQSNQTGNTPTSLF